MDFNFKEYFSGRTRFANCDCYFTFDKHLVKVFLMNIQQINILFDYIDSEDFNLPKWIFGKDEGGYDIALQITTKPKIAMSHPFFIYFKTPIIIKSKANCINIDLSYFRAIDFVGGTINVVHNPKLLVDTRERSSQFIKFREKIEYTSEYNIKFLGEECKLTYSIMNGRKDGNIINSSLGELESYIRIEFSEYQSIDKISEYYSAIKELLSFCVGQYNVDFSMRLLCRSDNNFLSQQTVCKTLQHFEDYVNLDSTQVIRLSFLTDRFPTLLELLNDKKKRPHLLFLPQCNRDVHFMSWANVRDICTALEREYELHNIKKENVPEVNCLIEMLQETIENHKGMLEYLALVERGGEKLSDDFYNSVKTTLRFIELPAKERFFQLYKRYQAEIRTITEDDNDKVIKIKKTYSEAEFEKQIQMFVKLRNGITHGGIINFEEQAEIYYHLILIVYMSVLERAGFTKQESAAILSWKFSNKF